MPTWPKMPCVSTSNLFGATSCSAFDVCFYRRQRRDMRCDLPCARPGHGQAHVQHPDAARPEARMRMLDQWPGYQQVLAPAPPPAGRLVRDVPRRHRRRRIGGRVALRRLVLRRRPLAIRLGLSVRSRRGPMFIRENLRAIEALGLPAEDLRKVLFGNAAAMMRLPG